MKPSWGRNAVAHDPDWNTKEKGEKKHPKMSPLPHGATETLANLLPERTKYSSLFFKPRNKRKDIYSVEQSETES